MILIYSMKTSAFIPTLILGSLAAANLPAADLEVFAASSPIAGGYHYDFTIRNNGLEDIVLVTINAPLADPLIDPSLTVPADFLGSYDSGIGLVDFLEFTGLFEAGSTKTGFSFDSTGAPPDFISQFWGLTVNGNTPSGTVQFGAGVPDGGATWLALAMSLASLGVAQRRFAFQRH